MNVNAVVRQLMKMTMTQLRAHYAEAFGEPTRSGNREYLVKRIIWRMQANVEGDLSERARRRAEELANDADLRVRAPACMCIASPHVVGELKVEKAGRLPMPGTLLTRQYKGRRIIVRVRDKGFEYEGEMYRSLSAVAKAVTGSHWNGYLFFNVPKPEDERLEEVA